ncbi:MAG: flavin reductase family protein, partial [Alphaproteobacteria bacterium]|nr:flavin reductase family protein [Alphaproteobacteria bacterium]
GLTMNSFSSVSLDPPLILFSLDKGSDGLDDFTAAEHFGVNILSDEHEELSTRFAMADDKSIRDDEFVVWESGAPILKDMIANLDCVPEKQIEGGDHIIFLCRVLDTGSSIGGDPLLYFRSRYFTVEPAVS